MEEYNVTVPRGCISSGAWNDGDLGLSGDVAVCTAKSLLRVVIDLSLESIGELFGTGDVGSSASFSTLGIRLRLTVALTSSSDAEVLCCSCAEEAASVDRGRGRLRMPVSPESEGTDSMVGKGGREGCPVVADGEPLEKSEGLGMLLLLALSNAVESKPQDAEAASFCAESSAACCSSYPRE